MLLGSVSNAAMEKALSGLWQRQQTISHNIANEDTPGYKAKRLDFESLLAQELSALRRDRTSTRESISRIGSLRAREYELGGLTGRADENNVDLDSEYIEMARNQIHYEAVQQKVNGYYTNLQYVISGGR
jgi:flagellar basal-body rod protein FlgB